MYIIPIEYIYIYKIDYHYNYNRNLIDNYEHL